MRRVFLFILIIFVVFPAFSHASKSGLAISSFQISGDSAYDEFVSIRNESTASIDLTNYYVARKTKTGTTWNTLYKFTGANISSHQTLVISHDKYTGVSDFKYSTSYYLSENYSIALIAPDKSIVDLVGYGEAGSFEGALLPNPVAKEVFSRTQDTDNNLNDFVSSVSTTSVDVNADKILITELMPAPSEGSEWIELFNPTNLRVNLAGLKLCDAIGSVHCYFFPNTEVLAPLEYKTYSQTITKITLNNTGDWVELRNSVDDVIADTGGNYGNADSGISLSLFGSEFVWTATPTPGVQNVYTDTVESETSSSSAKSTKAKKTTVKVAKATTVKTTASTSPTSDTASDASVVKGDSTVTGLQKAIDELPLSQKIAGIVLMALAVMVFIGYNLWDRRSYVKEFYDKISRRDR